GLAFATTAAGRGHQVDLYEAASEIGGQFNMAKKVPGKEEFYETIRYFNKQIQLTGVHLLLNRKVIAEDLLAAAYDEVVIATGVYPRKIDLPGIDHPKVLSYIDVLKHGKAVGKNVAVIGAGGIGFDVAEYLVHQGQSPSLEAMAFMKEWGVDVQYLKRGGLGQAQPQAPAREVYLLQRSKGKPGARLGKTTGWIHRSSLKMKKVKMWNNCRYHKIDDQGLHLSIGEEQKLLPVDNVIICAGQLPLRDLYAPLSEKGIKAHLIGGASEARELDAKRAIHQATKLAATI
ncbi:MAG TPA: NADPH-dependent 2,4-dienoyl-CoA reductase, partial [Phaeodactylibacter sp.]|nr:NADPH-dependent 2,4-dienoyl-CoA reductase [Phaeodactylibacter sp.]